jgi:hypothetical protein
MLEAKKGLADGPALRPDGPVRTIRGGGADGPRARRDS